MSLSMWDMDGSPMLRADLKPENVATDRFDIVFRTWGDTKVARVRVSWMAIGELRQADDWELY